MLEPRGHADMYGCLPVEPVTPDGDVGVLFLHNEGYSTMCGHGIIGLVKVGIECGYLLPPNRARLVRIDTPGRPRRRRALHRTAAGRVAERDVRQNVPPSWLRLDLAVEVESLGR